MNRTVSCVIALAASALTSPGMYAKDSASSVAIHGWADCYYALNGDRPEPRLNFFGGVGTTGHRADELALNVVALEIVRDPRPFGFHLIAGAGDSLDVVHTAEPHPKRHPLRNLYQASVSGAAPVGRGLLFEAGVYPSHIGFEAFFTKDNWSYTRGWLGELSPYYQSGVKTSYAWNGRWSAQVHALRGWQNVGARVPAAIGTQVAYSGARTSASFNTYADRHRRFGDLVATYKVTAKLSLGASIDRGRQAPANWLGLAAYARHAFTERWAIAGRAERYRDPGGRMSGTSQALSDETLTFEYRPGVHVIVKLEGRRDRSTAPVFANSRKQTLAIASAVVVF